MIAVKRTQQKQTRQKQTAHIPPI
ncbi:unnamed protein product [Timema podura]|uniref:Ribosomal protein S12 n=1 Tax=Timema podura TaxID=61482 RepID=A0ABN7NW26_TIMPD|nr:unnamed protein product [Timema podura]